MQESIETTIFNIAGLSNLKYQGRYLTGLDCTNSKSEPVFISVLPSTKNTEFSEFVEAYDIEAIYLRDGAILEQTADDGIPRQLLFLKNKEKQIFLENDRMARKSLNLPVDVFFQEGTHIASVIPKIGEYSFSSEFSGFALRKSQALESREPNTSLQRKYQLSIALLSMLCKLHKANIVFRSLKATDLRMAFGGYFYTLEPLHYSHAWQIQREGKTGPFVGLGDEEALPELTAERYEGLFLSSLLRKLWGIEGESPAGSPAPRRAGLANSGSTLFKPALDVGELSTKHQDIEDFVQALVQDLRRDCTEIYIRECDQLLVVFKKRFAQFQKEPQSTNVVDVSASDETKALLGQQPSACCAIL